MMTQVKRPHTGRKKGTPNKATRTNVQKTIAILAKADLTPLEVMLKAMCGDPNITPFMLAAAQAAAPYVHPRLQALDINAKVSVRDAKQLSEAELLAIAAGGSAGALAAPEDQD